MTAPLPSHGRHLNWADVCRTFAIFGVVLIHACGAFFYQFGKIAKPEWLQSVFLDSLARCSVPLFVMLSGGLLLGKPLSPRPWSDEFKETCRRAIRIFIPLVVWSAVYLWHLFRNGVTVRISSLLYEPVMYHLWFAYMMLGIYLVLPFLRSLFAVMRVSPGYAAYFFALWFAVTSIPVYWPIPALVLLQQNSLFGYGGFFLMGAMLVSMPQIPLRSSVWATLFGIGVVTTMLITWYLSDKAHAPVEIGFLYFSPNVVISSVAAFVLITRCEVSGLIAACFRFFGNCSFIVYFVHVLVLEYVRYSGTAATAAQHLPAWSVIILVSITTFAISVAIASLIKLIPGAHRVFG